MGRRVWGCRGIHCHERRWPSLCFELCARACCMLVYMCCTPHHFPISLFHGFGHSFFTACAAFSAYDSDTFHVQAFMCSKSFGLVLCAITGESFSTAAAETRCFSQGDYSMLCDPVYKQRMRADKRTRVTGDGGAGAPCCCLLYRHVADGTVSPSLWRE